MPNATGERRERPDDYPLKRFVVDVLAANDGPLAVSALIETGRWFGFREGSVRVCLSRLVRRGLLEVRDRHARAEYGFTRAADRFNREIRERVWFDQRRHWNGRWQLLLVSGAGASREVRERTARELRALHLRPIHASAWARPANVRLDLRPIAARLAAAGGAAEVLIARPEDGSALAARTLELWQVGHLRRLVEAELDVLATSRARLALVSRELALVESLRVGTRAFRLVASDPLLPLELLPADWPGERLRRAVIEYNHLACDLWADVAFGRPARNPHPHRPSARTPIRRARA